MGKGAKVVTKVLGLDKQEVPGISQKVYNKLVKDSEGILSQGQVDNMLRLRASDGITPKLKSSDAYLKYLRSSLYAPQQDALHGVQFLEGGKDRLRIAGSFADSNGGSISSVLRDIRKNPKDFDDINDMVSLIEDGSFNLDQVSSIIPKNSLFQKYGINAMDKAANDLRRITKNPRTSTPKPQETKSKAAERERLEREARLVAESPIDTDPNEIARKHGFALDANGKIVSPNRLTLEQVEEGKRRSSDLLRQEAAEREAAERERLDQQRFDREVSRVDTENDNLNHAHQALYAGPSEEKLEQMLKEAEAAKGILPFEQQLKEMNARADKRLQVKNANKGSADSIPASLEDLEKLPQPTLITNMFKEAQEKAKIEQKAADYNRQIQEGRNQVAEQRRLDSMTPEERGKYLQEQREAEAATRAGQRKAARALEEEPGGISYIGAEGGKSLNGKDLNGYESVYFDKDDVVSMLTKKHGESMGSKGAIEYMINDIEKDLNKGFERIMSSNSKDKRKEVDELIGSLATRIDDGPGLGDVIMGNKLHTGAIGLAAMAGTMGVAFGGHKSNAELYSSPF